MESASNPLPQLVGARTAAPPRLPRRTAVPSQASPCTRPPTGPFSPFEPLRLPAPAAGIPAHESTAWTLGWAWLVVFGNSAAVALAACAAFWVPGLKIGAVALLVLLTAFVAPLCSCFLQLHYSLVGTDYTTTRRAVDCAFSGVPQHAISPQQAASQQRILNVPPVREGCARGCPAALNTP